MIAATQTQDAGASNDDPAVGPVIDVDSGFGIGVEGGTRLEGAQIAASRIPNRLGKKGPAAIPHQLGAADADDIGRSGGILDRVGGVTAGGKLDDARSREDRIVRTLLGHFAPAPTHGD